MNAATLMMCSALLAAGGKPKLVVMDFTGGAGIDPAALASLSATAAAELNRRGVFEIVTSREVATALGVERQKQLLGCSDQSSSCLAELAGALGTDLVMTGNVANMGAAYTLTMQTVNATTGRAVGRAVRIASDLGELNGALAFAVAEASALPPPPTPSRVGPIIVMALGGASAVGGAVFTLQAFFKESEVLAELRLADTRNGPLRPASAYQDDANTVRMQKTIGLIGLIAGGALILGGALWYGLSGRAASPAVTAMLVPGPGGFALVGNF